MSDSKPVDIAIFGEALADIFPDRTVIGGAPLNVSRHLNAFGMHPVFITRLGEDSLKQEMMDVLSHEGLDGIGIQTDPSKQTGKVMVTIKNGEPSYDIVEDQAFDHIHSGMTHFAMVSIDPKVKYFGTLVQRNDTSRSALDQFIRDRSAPVFLDLNLREPWYTEAIIDQSLTYCDYAKMNEGELVTVCEMMDVEGETTEDLARALMVQFKLTQLIVTCGSKGCWAIDHQFKRTEAAAAALPGEMADTVGAGDGFASIYLLGIVLGWPIQLTLERANSFASAICTVHGAVPTSPAFYQSFKEAWQL